MAATLAQIREGLRARLATISDCQVSAYMLDAPLPPTLQVMGPDETQYDLAMQRGLDRWVMVIQGFSGSPADRGAQVTLDLWMAPTGAASVKAAVEGDITLGGVVQSARVSATRGYRIYDLPNAGRVLGSEWVVEVFNQGD